MFRYAAQNQADGHARFMIVDTKHHDRLMLVSAWKSFTIHKKLKIDAILASIHKWGFGMQSNAFWQICIEMLVVTSLDKDDTVRNGPKQQAP
jgi:hypothetical protein